MVSAILSVMSIVSQPTDPSSKSSTSINVSVVSLLTILALGLSWRVLRWSVVGLTVLAFVQAFTGTGNDGLATLFFAVAAGALARACRLSAAQRHESALLAMSDR